jgi:hypothetical protein
MDVQKSRFPETIIANTGKIIEFKGTEVKIVKSGIRRNGAPYVELDPPNKELRKRMIEELRMRGNFTVRLGHPNRIVLGESSYPIWT